MAFFRDAIGDGTFEFRAQRQHGAEHFAERRQVIIRDPFTQAHELLIEDGSGVENVEDAFGFYRRLAIMYLDDDARHPLLPERYQHSSAHHRLKAIRDVIGKGGIQRHRECDVAEFRHVAWGRSGPADEIVPSSGRWQGRC